MPAKPRLLIKPTSAGGNGFAYKQWVPVKNRITSGLTVLLVLGLLVWAGKRYPRRSPMRWITALVVFFTFTEALIGARLVLFGLVAQNASLDRAYAMIAHLVNTFLLIACITLTAWWASDRPPEGFFWHRGLSAFLLVGLAALIVLGASGAIAALGDTLFPVNSLSEGLRQDFNPDAHILTRLRVIHPMLAITIGLAIGGLAYWMRRRFTDLRIQQLTAAIMGLVVVQFLLGVVNVALLAPVAIQIVHLLVSDLIWLCLVLLAGVTMGTADLLPRLADQNVHDRVDQPKSVG